MNTVLLWGDAWWLDDRPEPLPVADLAGAADVLAAHFAPNRGDRRLRLIYQPDSLETVASPCPKGNRATLAAALAGEFPALGNPDCAWSHEPIRLEGDGFTTLLHFEREPGLFGLLAQLASRGFTIESVWPLPTFLDALPEPWPVAGAVTVLAVHPLRVCAYRRAADGRRSAPAWCGDAAGQEAAAWLEGILRHNPSEPVLLVGNADLVTAFAARVAGLEKPHTQWLPLEEALNRGIVVPRRHPAQLLPPTPVVTPQFAVIAASVAFLALAIWSGAAYTRDCLAWRTAGAAREAQKHALRAEVAQRRASAAEIAALRASLALASAGPPCGELLRRLAATVPLEVALDSLRVSADGFSLNGHVAPHAPASAVDGWRARLSAGQTPWQLHTATPPTADGAFAFAGRFQR